MSVSIALGSASQIALFVAPVLVLLSYRRDMRLGSYSCSAMFLAIRARLIAR